jgi:hypothetical protein
MDDAHIRAPLDGCDGPSVASKEGAFLSFAGFFLYIINKNEMR